MKLIDRYIQAARPFMDLLPQNSCIEQTRILKECLQSFGATVEPFETRLCVTSKQHEVMFLSGCTQEEVSRGKATAKSWIEKPTTTPSDEMGGHVIALVSEAQDWYLVDSTLSQASAPEFGFIIEPAVVAIGPLPQKPQIPAEIEVEATENGVNVQIRWLLKNTRSFVWAPAWEPSHLWPIIYGIINDMELSFEPDNGQPHLFRRRIVKVIKIKGTRTGNACRLECGHMHMTFGDLSRVSVNGVICKACENDAERI